MIRNGVYVTANIDSVTPRKPAPAPASDSRPRNLRVDVFNHLPQRKSARAGLDAIASTLDSIAKAMSKPAKKPQTRAATSATLMPVDLRADYTRDTLVAMNKRGRDFWHGAK